MMKYWLIVTLYCVVAIFFYGCRSASSHQEAVSKSDAEEFTLGNVQKRVRVGMTQADVAAALGSPNLVTRDPNGKEAWVYDKIGSEVTYSSDEGGIWLIVADYRKQAGAQRTSQKTLTVIIKFDDKGLVESVSYHSSQF